MIQTQGDFQQTGNQLDLAIQGNGFFQVQLPSGELAYTRAGSFQVSAQGQIVNADGYALQPAISIPNNATSITIGTDGTVSVALPGQQQAQLVGQIQLATFANPGGLNSTGQNLFLPTTASGDAILGTAGGSEGPVSYTHLDVYKRQRCSWPRRCAAARSAARRCRRRSRLFPKEKGREMCIRDSS